MKLDFARLFEQARMKLDFARLFEDVRGKIMRYNKEEKNWELMPGSLPVHGNIDEVQVI